MEIKYKKNGVEIEIKEIRLVRKVYYVNKFEEKILGCSLFGRFFVKFMRGFGFKFSILNFIGWNSI